MPSLTIHVGPGDVLFEIIMGMISDEMGVIAIRTEDLGIDEWRRTLSEIEQIETERLERLYITHRSGGYLSREALEWSLQRADVWLFVPGSLEDLKPFHRELATTLAVHPGDA